MTDNQNTTLSIEEISHLLPHRFPFLMLDKVLQYTLDSDNPSLVAKKNVTINEQHFLGHFPNLPVMPGVLITEAMAQASALLALKMLNKNDNEKSNENNIIFLSGIDKAKFRKPVVPGDTLIIHSTYVIQKFGLWKFDCKAEVDNKVVSSATISAVHQT